MKACSWLSHKGQCYEHCVGGDRPLTAGKHHSQVTRDPSFYSLNIKLLRKHATILCTGNPLTHFNRCRVRYRKY